MKDPIAYRTYAGRRLNIDDSVGTRLLIQEQHRAWRKRQIQQALADLTDVIYFVRVGSLIKIGYTSNLRQRLRNSNLGAALGDLLLIIPGTMADEKTMHARFTDSLAKGAEWYHPTPNLIDFINAKRAEMGLSSLT